MDAAGALAHRSLDFRMAGVADHHDLAALFAHSGNLGVHLGHQRTGRVENAQPARFGICTHGLGYSVRRKHDDAAGRYLGELLDEDGTFGLEVVDDVPVVDDLVAHVDRRAELRERLLDDRDRTIDTGAEPAGIGEQDVHHEPFGLPAGSPRRIRKLSMMSRAAPTVIALSATLNAGYDQRA